MGAHDLDGESDRTELAKCRDEHGHEPGGVNVLVLDGVWRRTVHLGVDLVSEQLEHLT